MKNKQNPLHDWQPMKMVRPDALTPMDSVTQDKYSLLNWLARTWEIDDVRDPDPESAIIMTSDDYVSYLVKTTDLTSLQAQDLVASIKTMKLLCYSIYLHYQTEFSKRVENGEKEMATTLEIAHKRMIHYCEITPGRSKPVEDFEEYARSVIPQFILRYGVHEGDFVAKMDEILTGTMKALRAYMDERAIIDAYIHGIDRLRLNGFGMHTRAMNLMKAFTETVKQAAKNPDLPESILVFLLQELLPKIESPITEDRAKRLISGLEQKRSALMADDDEPYNEIGDAVLEVVHDFLQLSSFFMLPASEFLHRELLRIDEVSVSAQVAFIDQLMTELSRTTEKLREVNEPFMEKAREQQTVQGYPWYGKEIEWARLNREYLEDITKKQREAIKTSEQWKGVREYSDQIRYYLDSGSKLENWSADIARNFSLIMHKLSDDRNRAILELIVESLDREEEEIRIHVTSQVQEILKMIP